MRRAFTTGMAAIGFWVCATSLASAQEWPKERPIQWIVGFAPGGAADVITRAIADRLSKALGQAIVVENRTGAVGAIAARAVSSAPADGYTLLTIPGPILHQTAVPDVGVDLASVALIGSGPMIFIGPLLSDVPDLKTFIERAKAEPAKFNFGSSGVGSSQHIGGELLNEKAGTRIAHVPYRGGGQIINDVLSGTLQAAMLGVGPAAPHIEAGKVRGYAVTTATRFPKLPAVPTMAEAGVPGIDLRQWFGVAAPKDTPATIVTRFNKEINAAINQSDLRELILRQGIEPANAPPDAFAKAYTEDNKLYKDMAIRFGIKVQ